MTTSLISLFIVLSSSCLIALFLKGIIVFKSVGQIYIYSFAWALSLTVFLYSSGVLGALIKACGNQ